MTDHYLLKIMAEALRGKARVHANARASGCPVDPIQVLNAAADELEGAAGGTLRRTEGGANTFHLPVKYFELVVDGELKSIGHPAGKETVNMTISRINDIDQVADENGKPIVAIMEGITIRVEVSTCGLPWNDTSPTVTH